jgi:hypothetical protein
VTIDRLAKSPVVNNTSPLPGSSKSRGKHSVAPQDPTPSSSSSGCHHHNPSSSPTAGTSQLTPNRRRFDIDWSEPPEVVNNSQMDTGGDGAVYSDEPPPSFDDALLEHTYVPGVGQRSEGSHAGHHHSIRLAAGKESFFFSLRCYYFYFIFLFYLFFRSYADLLSIQDLALSTGMGK